MSFELPKLPYEKNALEPHISEETINYHYGKHHQTYVNNLNNLLAENKDYANLSLEEIIQKAPSGGIFNNAAQVWNHTFYWNSLSPNGGGKPTGALLESLEKSFGSFDAFVEEFTKQATANFGSGWTWLVKKSDGSLAIVNTSNADTPVKDKSLTPILTVDIWEHAYYIDYRNARPEYLKHFWELVNWEFASKNLG
ncbi:MAG: superoxide dismutase [Fe] [Neisseriaceae bacterium]|nr:superoxide dismutase [Fe] [Neisseriaceae bacterium]MCV2509161.1 superoxide dismutase [Fe] [Neisseriaceae bacterium]